MNDFKDLPITIERTTPSVCIQRNLGIKLASGDFIFLCDDDMAFGANYLSKLENYLAGNPKCVAVSGQWLQQENNVWVNQFPPKRFSQLLWRFIFQLSIWGDLESVKWPFFLRPLNSLIKRFYFQRGNTITLAGWPLITKTQGEVFQTMIYSLGACMLRREYLLESLYDEVLDPSGIGDNYGVAIGFPGDRPIHVLTNLDVYHHRSTSNRLEKPLGYFRRILALHYFIKRSARFQQSMSVWFQWSLVGNWLYFFFKGRVEMRKATTRAIRLILSGKNPYWIGSQNGGKIVQPFYTRGY
jgi:GT2 family glycosyltransferase